MGLQPAVLRRRSNVSGLYSVQQATPDSRLPFLESPRASAGFPSPAGDYLEGALDLTDYLIRNKVSTFYFAFEGDSLEANAVLDGDIGACDRSIPPTVGRIVLASVDGDFLAKVYEIHAGRPALVSRNDRIAYPPIYLDKGQEITLWGRVVAIARKS